MLRSDLAPARLGSPIHNGAGIVNHVSDVQRPPEDGVYHQQHTNAYAHPKMNHSRHLREGGAPLRSAYNALAISPLPNT